MSGGDALAVVNVDEAVPETVLNELIAIEQVLSVNSVGLHSEGINHGVESMATGGSRGIGRAIALQLAKDGFDVTITYRSNQELAEKVVEELQGCGVNAPERFVST